MGDDAYSQATSTTGTVTSADLGNVETSVTNTSATEPPDLTPMRTLTAPIDGVVPAGLLMTDLPQRGAVPERGPLDIIAARPQLQAPYRAFIRSYATHTPVSIAGLDSSALAVDLGSVWRFVVDASTLNAAPKQLNGVTGAHGWTPSQGSGDLVHVGLDIYELDGGSNGDVDFLNNYYSRLGNIIRPSVGLQNSAIMLKATSAYSGDSPLLSPQTEAFTVAFVADIDDPPWAFCDLVSTYSNVTVPGTATSCCLRLIGDRLIVYGHGARAFDEIISNVAAAELGPLNLETRRPTIIVWAMDSAGTGSLVVVTPKVSRHADLSFPSGIQWQLPSTAYKFTPPLSSQPAGGLDANMGGFMLGYTNYEDILIGDEFGGPQADGSACVWSPYDIALWDTALDTGSCIEIATMLDNVYGTSR